MVSTLRMRWTVACVCGALSSAGCGSDVRASHTMAPVERHPGARLATASGTVSFTESRVSSSGGYRYDSYGGALVAAGDVNGDGFDDLAVSAYQDDDQGNASGAVYLYYGSLSGVQASTEQKVSASDGSVDDNFGRWMAGVGDLDGDGFTDLVAGSYGADEATSEAGAAYVYLGSSTGLAESSEQKVMASDAGFWDRFGGGVGGGGDIDGDGHDDFVVAAYDDDDRGSGSGSIYVFYGSTTGVDLGREDKLTTSDVSVGANLGQGVAIAGDIDGDGHADIVAGAPGDDDHGSYAGAAYVFLGAASGIGAGTEQKITPVGADSEDRFGLALSAAGDVDGDGFGDLVFGTRFAADLGGETGAAYVFYGSSTGVAVAREQRFLASDTAASDELGYAVAGGQDLDLDGFDDIIVTAQDHTDSVAEAGAAYVYFGSSTGLRLDTEAKILVSDGGGGDRFGDAAAMLGDVDGDGAGDLGVSAVNDDGVSNLGVAFVFGFICTDDDEDGVCAGADCDDDDAAVHPGAVEVAGDHVDQDCDGVEICYADADDDGYTDGSEVTSTDASCSGPGELDAAAPGGDCDDDDPASHPGAAEVPGDGTDQDCDGEEQCYADGDADGYTDGGLVASSDLTCSGAGTADASVATGDCDDDDDAVHPGADEVCNDRDDDCDGTVDGPDSLDAMTWAPDSDGDGHTASSDALTDCAPPEGYADPSDSEDCDDGDGSIHPGATELPGDGIDQDCDGVDAEDDSGGGTDKADSGCGCTASAGGDAGLLVWALAALAAWRRRRSSGSAHRLGGCM